MKTKKGIAHATLLLILCLISAGCSLLNTPPVQPTNTSGVTQATSQISQPVPTSQNISPTITSTQKIENAITNIANIANNTNTVLQTMSGTLSNTVNYGSAIIGAIAGLWALIKGHQAYVNNTVASAVNSNAQKPKE